MHIVLPGALPDPEVAADLAPHVAERAPTLVRWLSHGKAQPASSAPRDTWCTPWESSLLELHGFHAAQAEHVSAGLGPLRSPGAGNEPVWLAELVHMAPSRDGAALLPADRLGITEADSRALLDSARDHLEDHPVRLEFDTPAQWRVHWPEPLTLPCASPALVALSAVNDWWPSEPHARPWRQLVNTLQMAWFDHPVNTARAASGLPPVNSLWLYGGARPTQLTQAPPIDLSVNDSLASPAMAQDWGGWLGALALLERDCFEPMTSVRPTLVLCGRDRYVTVLPLEGWWARLRKQDWRTWWCNR